MDYFKTLFEQFVKFWQQTSPLSRFGMVATVLICIGMIVAVGYWSSQPHYVTVANNLSPDKAAQVVDQLEKEGIAAKLNFSGSAILVDETKLNRARAVAKQIVPDENLADSQGLSWNAGPEQRRNNMYRMLEQRLARTIMRLRAVEHATVHLYVAKNVRIESMQKESTASVLVKLRPGAELTQLQGDSIVSIVANGVEGLEPKNVKVLDDSGRVLSQPETIFGHGINHVALRRDTEKYLKYKVESILTQMLGPGKATITVSADVDLKKIDSKSKQYSPEDKMTKTEKRVIETTKGKPSGGAVGIAGTSSNNSNTGNTSSAKTTTTHQREESESTFDFGHVETVKTELPDWVKRLSVAAVVDLTPDEGDTQSPNVDLAAIELLIKSAIGFDESRGDTIKVINTKMAGNPFAEEPIEIATPVNTQFILNLVRQSSLGLGALFAFVIGFLLVRKMKPITVKESDSQISPERAKHLTELTIVAKENPELLARIVAAWINEAPADATATSESPVSEKRAA